RDDRLASADKLAKIMGLEYADRQRLGIFTIGAIDKTKRQRAIERLERKREYARMRAEAKRRERGGVSRKGYLTASLSQTGPWEAEGISRRTWERRRYGVKGVDACSSGGGESVNLTQVSFSVDS